MHSYRNSGPRGVSGMSYEHQVIKMFDGQESYAYYRDTIKTSLASVRACSLFRISLDEFFCTI